MSILSKILVLLAFTDSVHSGDSDSWMGEDFREKGKPGAFGAGREKGRDPMRVSAVPDAKSAPKSEPNPGTKSDAEAKVSSKPKPNSAPNSGTASTTNVGPKAAEKPWTEQQKKDWLKRMQERAAEKQKTKIPLADNIALADKKVKKCEKKLEEAKQKKDKKLIKALTDRLRTARITRKQMGKSGQLQTLPSIWVSFIIIIIAAYCLY